MASLGIPIFNDPLYPQLQTREDDDFSRPLQLLAKAIAFTDPLTGAPRKFESLQTLRLSAYEHNSHMAATGKAKP
jgi:tRNA pseudouridine32 synthase/23S rRNA pseudouridine746 synthase